jgi:hypothetical protein
MTGNPVDRQALQDLATAHPEVEFALVLARTIESVRDDPEQLRFAIYELARQKLREQFGDEDDLEMARLIAALEVAIQGVEAHSKKGLERQTPTDVPDRLPFSPQPGRPDRAQSTVPMLEAPDVGDPEPNDGSAPGEPSQFARHVEQSPLKKKPRRLAVPGRFLLVIAAVLALAMTIKSRQFSAPQIPNAPAQTAPVQAAKISLQPPTVELPKQVPLLPTTYGIYAVSAGQLFQLDPWQFRAPDIRVAVSSAITMPSRTILPDGDVRFIVFRRDVPGSVPDQLDVRIVARIEQAINFDTSGKPVVSKAEENWVIRNIAFPYRTAPIRDNPEMYEVQSKDPHGQLVPGRYVLVIKGQAYDFTVAGHVTDAGQCLGRVSASNGTFYSECQKLQ